MPKRKEKVKGNADSNLYVNINSEQEMVESFRTRMSSLKLLEQLNKRDLPSPLEEKRTKKSIDVSR